MIGKLLNRTLKINLVQFITHDILQILNEELEFYNKMRGESEVKPDFDYLLDLVTGRDTLGKNIKILHDKYISSGRLQSVSVDAEKRRSYCRKLAEHLLKAVLIRADGESKNLYIFLREIVGIQIIENMFLSIEVESVLGITPDLLNTLIISMIETDTAFVDVMQSYEEQESFVV